MKSLILKYIAKLRSEYSRDALDVKRRNRIKQQTIEKTYSSDFPRAVNAEKTVFFVCNGKISHAGLADRLRGLVTVYQQCKRAGVQFKVYFVSPFSLQDFLQPNKYDWLAQENEFSYNKNDSAPLCYYLLDSFIRIDDLIYNKIKTLNFKQIHFYTNSWYSYHNNFGKSFNELFKPSANLQQNIDFHLQKIGGKYIGLQFRFLKLLDDFNEYGMKTLNDNDRKALIEKCLDEIEKAKSIFSEYQKFLLCSDSITFLNAARKFDFVYIVKGEILHIDNTEKTDNSGCEAYLKTFLDLFLLSKADRILSFATKEMRFSGLPKIASYFGGNGYERIEINTSKLMHKEKIK